jgi:flagellar biosynthetic protein FliQ
MTQEAILAIGQQAILMMLLLGGPILVVSLVVGLAVSVFQAVTQINEQTLTFVPKIIAVLAILVVMGPWMLQVFTAYTAQVFVSVATLAR